MKKSLLIVVGMAIVGFIVRPELNFGQQRKTLTVFAASSLTDAFEEIAIAFESENPNVQVQFSFAGSSTLATQIIEGAPGDVFASANTAQMQRVIDEGLIAGEPITFARNQLVLLVPEDNPASIESLADLANPGIRLILAAPEVPVRTYTDTMLSRLAADSDFGEAYRTAVLENIVSEEPNVRQVSAKVALGEADAGIVYHSDVTPDIAARVFALPIPDEFNTIATYPIAQISESGEPELAQQFIRFVLSDTGQDILETWQLISIRGSQRLISQKTPAVGVGSTANRSPEG